MIDAIQDAMEYFDQRADVQGDNPSAPNEEMCLWEELNQAAKEIAELEARALAAQKLSQDMLPAAMLGIRAAEGKAPKALLTTTPESPEARMTAQQCRNAQAALAELEGK